MATQQQLTNENMRLSEHIILFKVPDFQISLIAIYGTAQRQLDTHTQSAGGAHTVKIITGVRVPVRT